MDQERPKLFALFNMLGVMTKRNFDYPYEWFGPEAQTRYEQQVQQSGWFYQELNFISEKNNEFINFITH